MSFFVVGFLPKNDKTEPQTRKVNKIFAQLEVQFEMGKLFAKLEVQFKIGKLFASNVITMQFCVIINLVSKYFMVLQMLSVKKVNNLIVN